MYMYVQALGSKVFEAFTTSMSVKFRTNITSVWATMRW